MKVAVVGLEHTGYSALNPSARHRRTVRLDRAARCIDIVDESGGGHDVRLASHLGPDVHAELDGASAILRWPAAAVPEAARPDLPGGLRWSLHPGESDPILGWYSSGLGRRVPAGVLLGCGRSAPGEFFSVPGEPFSTRLELVGIGTAAGPAFTQPDV
jgi:Heparinase II/III-like protein